MIEGMGTSRDRKIFLGVSALIVLAVVIAAREVLLPFVLALVVAYVLTPAVRRVERRRIPRWIAILIVYALTFGSIALSIQQIVPRLVLRVDSQRAEVDYDGRPAWVDCRPIDGLQPGEYVNVYAGVALERLSQELALELLAFNQELERLLADASQDLFAPAPERP